MDMSEDNIAIRLKFLISELGINSSVFADKCGISRATLSQLLTGRNKKVNDILISQIHKAYPNLSIMWLLFNEGSMWNNSSGYDSSKDSTELPSDLPGNPISEQDNTSGLASSIETTSVSRKNPSENLNFQGGAEAFDQNSKETGLKSTENTLKGTIDQEINSRIKTAALMNEIEILRSKIKKVVQITIYYDDSTFESFFPK